VLKSRFRAFPKISFEANSSTLTPQGRAAVGRIAKILSPSKFGVKVKVVGHTDLDGSAAVNRRLSAARARAVVMELMRKGVPSARLSASGVGESQPLVSPERTAADKATNRRVEFLPII
jgi:OOP family OmpA-OmpF porin